MTRYNRSKTAYSVNTDYGTDWYLVPRGRDRAPRFWQEVGPMIPRDTGVSYGIMDELTPKDRETLLDACDAGLFREVWDQVLISVILRMTAHDEDRHRRALVFLDRREELG